MTTKDQENLEGFLHYLNDITVAKENIYEKELQKLKESIKSRRSRFYDNPLILHQATQVLNLKKDIQELKEVCDLVKKCMMN